MEEHLRIIYLTRKQVLDTYSKTIDYSGGGLKGSVYVEMLDRVLDYVQDDVYYPTFGDKLTYLIYSINRGHIFADGNKRLSITVGALFMLLNGYISCMNRYLAEMENISRHVAAGRIDDALLKELVCSMINGNYDYDEWLKYRYLEAISEGGIGMDMNDKRYKDGSIMPPDGKKTVFISYCWENDNHQEWVKRLAEDLTPYFKVRIDQKLPLGWELNRFMEQSVAESDKVLIITTPEYKERADNRKRGVGYETSLITDDLVNDQNRVKFIPVIRKGTKEMAFPRYLGSRKGLYMTDDDGYEEQLEELIKNLLEY